jgi:hypothetical protein
VLTASIAASVVDQKDRVRWHWGVIYDLVGGQIDPKKLVDDENLTTFIKQKKIYIIKNNVYLTVIFFMYILAGMVTVGGTIWPGTKRPQRPSGRATSRAAFELDSTR